MQKRGVGRDEGVFAYSHTCFSSPNEQMLSLGFFSVVLVGWFGFFGFGVFLSVTTLRGSLELCLNLASM